MKRRILLIDDEPEVTYMLRLMLESQGYFKVEEVNDATVALAAGRQFQPDLIVLDIMMPGIDGSELAARFLEDPQLQGVPQIFLTALVDRQETFAEAGWFVRGGRTFLPKPVTAEQLIGCIEQKLAGKSNPIAPPQP